MSTQLDFRVRFGKEELSDVDTVPYTRWVLQNNTGGNNGKTIDRSIDQGLPKQRNSSYCYSFFHTIAFEEEEAMRLSVLEEFLFHRLFTGTNGNRICSTVIP